MSAHTIYPVNLTESKKNHAMRAQEIDEQNSVLLIAALVRQIVLALNYDNRNHSENYLKIQELNERAIEQRISAEKSKANWELGSLPQAGGTMTNAVCTALGLDSFGKAAEALGGGLSAVGRTVGGGRSSDVTRAEGHRNVLQHEGDKNETMGRSCRDVQELLNRFGPDAIRSAGQLMSIAIKSH